MDKKKLAKQAAIIAACTGIAIAAPQFAPFLAFASKDLIGDVFSQFFTENDKTVDSIGKIGISAVGGILTNLASSAIWDVPNSLGGGKQNEDLARALGQAYRNSLDVIESKIADDVVKEQAAEVFPLLRARLDRALAAKNREDELLALFPLRKIEKNQQPQQSAQ